MKKMFTAIVTTAFCFGAAFAQTSATKSVYTDTASEKCRTVESDPNEGGSYLGECAGVGGYKLEVIEGDLRQTVNVVAPNRRKHELNLWSVVSSGFSSIGEKAEWRVGRNGKPSALILRYNASENPEKPEQNTSYLVVVKITSGAACVTDIVKPSADANERARKSADAAANKPCRSSN